MMKNYIHLLIKKRIIVFGITGGLGYGVNALSLELFSYLGLPEFLIWLLSTECAIIAIYSINSLWLFGDVAKEYTKKKIVQKFFAFQLSSMFAVIIQTFFGYALTNYFGEAYRQYILIGVILCIVAPYNWYMYHRHIWKKG